ncbi:MAG: hypothetical protein AB1689_24885 [Thermodesulfobacteriota bacterium]
MKQIANERGIVLVVALGLTIALAALSLTVARSGQMSTLTGALSAQLTRAFYLADGAAYHALGDVALFQPDDPPVVRTKDLNEIGMDSQAAVVFTLYRALPGNLLIRTTDGKVRPAQFGQNEGLGKMYYFDVDGVRNAATTGVDPRSAVQMQAARPGPCADCGT